MAIKKIEYVTLSKTIMKYFPLDDACAIWVRYERITWIVRFTQKFLQAQNSDKSKRRYVLRIIGTELPPSSPRRGAPNFDNCSACDDI